MVKIVPPIVNRLRLNTLRIILNIYMEVRRTLPEVSGAICDYEAKSEVVAFSHVTSFYFRESAWSYACCNPATSGCPTRLLDSLHFHFFFLLLHQHHKPSFLLHFVSISLYEQSLVGLAAG
jgi:hypothetical protein